MSYEAYVARVPVGKLKLVLDQEHDGLDIHLGKIAGATDEWDTVLAPHMGLTDQEMKDIRKNHSNDRAVQRKEILRLWKAKSGRDATYGNLMRICYDHENRGCAAQISKLWSESEMKALASEADINIGMLLLLKNDAPEYMALKKYEDELISSLINADLVALTKRAVQCNLVPNDLVSYIEGLDQNIQWSHSLKWKFLLYSVYTTLQKPSSAANRSYEKWLGLISTVKTTAVTGLLSRMKKYQLSMENAIATRVSSSEEGENVLNMEDVSLLAEVLPGTKKWKAIAISLQKVLADSDIESIVKVRLNATSPVQSLKEVLTLWILNQFTNAKLPTLDHLEEALRKVGFDLHASKLRSDLEKRVDSYNSHINSQVALIRRGLKRDLSVEDDSKIEFKEIDIPLLTSIVDGFSDKWKTITHSIRVPYDEEKLSSYETPAAYFKEVLTDWINFKTLPVIRKKEKLNAQDPTVQNFSEALLKAASDDIRKSDKEEITPEMVFGPITERIAQQVALLKKETSLRLSSILKGDQLERGDISLLIDTVALIESSGKWEEIAYFFLWTGSEADTVLSMLLDRTPVNCLKKVLAMWMLKEFPNAEATTLGNLVQLFDSNEATHFKENLIKEGTKGTFFEAVDEGLKITNASKSSRSLKVLEGRTALLEVEISSTPEDPVAFEWVHDGQKLSSKNRLFSVDNCYRGSGGTILCLYADGTLADGAYRCRVSTKGRKEILSQPVNISVSTLINQYSGVLRSFYTEQPEVPEDTWPPVSARSYINLALIKQDGLQDPDDDELGRTTIRGDVDDVYGDKESIMYDRAFNRLESGTRLLVEGRPGSGKTTLVHKVSQDWASGRLTFNNTRLLFLVHLRAFSSDPNVGLREILQCYYSSESVIKTIVDYAEKHGGLGLSFILDGLDEYVPNKSSSTYIYRLMKKQVLPKATVIIASRPAAAVNFRKTANKQVEVIGFLTEEIYDYIDKYPFSKENDLFTYFDKHPNVLHMCYLPIHAAMICFLFDHLETELPQTETEIYAEFTKHTILRILYREDESQDFIDSIDDLDETEKRCYSKICKLAYEMITSSRQVAKQSEVKSFFNIQDEKDTLGLVTTDRMATRLGFQKMYTFLHLTFQEFLGASFISNLDDNEQIKLIEKYGRDKKLQQVWKFYCGLAKFDGECKKFKALIDNTDYGNLFKVQCSFESQQSCVCDAVVENSSLSFNDVYLSPTIFAEIAFVISNAQNNPVERLSFDGCTYGEEEVDVFVDKAGDKLSIISSLRHYRCDIKQLQIVNRLLVSMPRVKVLEVSRVLGADANIQVIQVGSKERALYFILQAYLRSPSCTVIYSTTESFESDYTNIFSLAAIRSPYKKTPHQSRISHHHED